MTRTLTNGAFLEHVAVVQGLVTVYVISKIISILNWPLSGCYCLGALEPITCVLTMWWNALYIYVYLWNCCVWLGSSQLHTH